MRSFLPCLLLSLAPVSAQQTLAELQAGFRAAMRELGANATYEQRDQLRARQIPELQKFLADAAKGDDRWNGRLMLADLQLGSGDRKAAAATLQTIAVEQAPALLLISAAGMAQHLNQRELRAAFVGAALGKPVAQPDRLAMARLLATVLHEVEASENLFRTALAEAKHDDDRALVRWHRADTMRDREDLPDNAGFEELEKLATDLPNTYWGNVARDRLRATRLQPGDPGIAFSAKTRSGAPISLAELSGKVVVLMFWSASDRDLPALLTVLRDLQKELGAALAIVGICLDREPALIDEAVRAFGMTFPVVGDGKGIETDAALRWFVEGPVVHVVDPEGKVAALGQHAGTADARSELGAAVRRARR